MNPRTRILKLFNSERVGQVVWQPSIMYWYTTNGVGRLNPDRYVGPVREYVPEEFVGMDIIDLYRAIKGSIRYPHESLNLHSFYTTYKAGSNIVPRGFTNEQGENVLAIKTPAGTVQEKRKYGFPVEYFVKSIGDLATIEYIVSNTEYCFNPYIFEAANEVIGDLGVMQTYNFRSPYQRCVIEFLGFIRTTRFLRTHPQQMDDFMNVLEAWDARAYDTILASPLQVVSFGENLHAKVAPPPVFERYHLPYYKEHARRVHEKGKFCHIHFDGDVKDLLPFVSELPFDGLEAITFAPQGDVMLDEVKDAMGNTILIDGIPSDFFLPAFSTRRLVDFTRELLDTFFPRIILGISDELCPTMDGRRLRVIGDLADSYFI